MKKNIFFMMMISNFFLTVTEMGAFLKAPTFLSAKSADVDLPDQHLFDFQAMVRCQAVDQDTQNTFDKIKKTVHLSGAIKLLLINMSLPAIVHLNPKKTVLYIDQQRYENMLPSQKIRVLLTAAYLIKNNLSNRDFLSVYYQVAKKVDCHICLQEWANTIHFCADSAYPCKDTYCLNSLEKFSKIKKDDGSIKYCKAHENIPLSCALLEVGAMWVGTHFVMDKFEKCLNNRLSDYLPR